MARILIIDDDASIRTAFRPFLERAGHEVIEAKDGRTGIELHEARPADLVITDLYMPGHDGIETIRHLRRQYPGLKIIAWSGADQTGTMDLREAAQLLGAQRTFKKPVDVQQLLVAVEDLLSSIPKPPPRV